MNAFNQPLPRSQADSDYRASRQSPTSWHQRLLLWLASYAGGMEAESAWYWRYGVAVMVLIIATATRHLLDPVLGERAPYGIYLLGVIFVAWQAGFGPAMLTVAGGTLLGRYFFDSPRFTLWAVTESSEVALVMSLIVSIVTVLFSESLRLAARENRRMYALAREADARKDAFLATLAHELRNPLMPIQNALYLLERQHPNDSQTLELQQLMNRQTNHLIRLVNELLEVSRFTKRKIELCPEQVELFRIVESALEVVRPLMAEKRQELQVTMPKQQILLNADGMRLTQVLTNLLHNATKYTNQDGRIWLLADVAQRDLVIRIRDTGVGFDPQLSERIFDLFEQAHQGIEASQGGLGIGLTLVRELVHLHGGTVEAHSAGAGLGSEFTVRLPVVSTVEYAPPEISQLTKEADATGQPALRILVVDDSPSITKSLEMVLLDWKHDVQTCADGFAALDVARSFKPNVVLTDLGMPRMNGYQLAEALRRLPELSSTVLIAVSGYGQEADKQRSQAVGFARHLTKPVDLLELKQLLDSPPSAN